MYLESCLHLLLWYNVSQFVSYRMSDSYEIRIMLSDPPCLCSAPLIYKVLSKYFLVWLNLMYLRIYWSKHNISNLFP